MSSELKLRTKQFSISIFEIVDLLPNKASVKVVSYQLAKFGSSVGANYRAACRARSDKEFIAKMNIVLEESDETMFWLEIIKEFGWIDSNVVEKLLNESNELTSIFVTILKKMNLKENSK